MTEGNGRYDFLAWARDNAIPGEGTANHVLLYLATRADPDTGQAWPAVGTIARETGRGERTVREALRVLEAKGLIETAEQGGGRRKATTYVLCVTGKPANGAGYPDETRRTSPGNGHHNGAGKPANGAQNPAAFAQNPANFAPKEPRISKKKESNPPYPPRAGGGTGADEAFIRFWDLYPNPTGIDAARRTFRRLVRRGIDPAEIVGGIQMALAYDMLNLRRNGQYLPTPAKWLRDGCYNDWREAPRESVETANASARH